MDIATLNTRLGRGDRIAFEAGRGGLPMLRIHNAAASALISLYGGQVLSYRPHADDDLLFLSELAFYEEGRAIKGGIPICWPWFGADPEGRGRPAHGFARNRLWTAVAAEEPTEGLTRVVLRLQDDAESQALWPHAFELTLEVEIGSTLVVRLATRNTGREAITITQALHTYLAVRDIGQVRVTGLDGCEYLDKVLGLSRHHQQGPIAFTGEVDRIVLATPSRCAVDDAASPRRVLIDADGSQTTVVWNPWQEIAAASADLADDDYRRFVCVETANAADEVITLASGATHRMAAEYRIEAARPD